MISSGFSEEWDDTVSEHPDAEELHQELSRLRDPETPLGTDELERLLEVLGELLDLWDEEPMGDTYYPFKTAELIELYCRMATGDLPDDAPVPLAEWVERFAGHVDWQLAKSGVDLGRPHYFTSLEESLQSAEAELTGQDGPQFREFLERCRDTGEQYVSALNSALR
ncbi:hypothetical protein ACE14D_12285 [Streptomyces sp. Act-28]